MKRCSSLAITLIGLLCALPAYAQMGMMDGKGMKGQDQQQQMPQGMMGGGMMMGRSMMSGMNGMNACMMGSCWKSRGMMMGRSMMGKGMISAMGCPNPAMTIKSAVGEIRGYLRMAEILNLNENQVKKIGEIRHNLAVTLIRKRADLQIAVLEMQKLMSQEMPDVDLLSTQVDKTAALWKDIQMASIKASLEARAVLTPEQRTKASKMHMSCMKCMNAGSGDSN